MSEKKKGNAKDVDEKIEKELENISEELLKIYREKSRRIIDLNIDVEDHTPNLLLDEEVPQFCRTQDWD